MKIKYTVLVVIFSVLGFLFPVSPASGVESFPPGQDYSVDEIFDCVDTYTYSYNAYVRIDSGTSEGEYKPLPFNVVTNEFGDCDSVYVSGTVKLPFNSGSYTVVVSLFYDQVEAYKRSYDIEIGSIAGLEADISWLSWVPGVLVDVEQAPRLEISFRMQNNQGGYAEEYCPESVEIQFAPRNSTWRNLKVVHRDRMTCASGESMGHQTLMFQTPGAGRIRALVDGQPTQPKRIKIVKPQNKFRFSNFSTNKKYVHWIGDKIYIGGYLEQRLQNGIWVNLQKYKHKVRVQKLSGGRWVPAGSCYHYLYKKWTWTGCGPVENRPGIKLRMMVGNAVAVASGFEAKSVRFGGIYLRNGWPNCHWGELTLYVGTRGTNGKEWPRPVKIILQHRDSRFDSWKNIDFDYSTKSHWATFNYTSCYGGYFRLYAPAQGKYLESGLYH